MEKIRFIKNAHVVLKNEANGEILEDRWFEGGVSWETSREVATRLIAEGVAVPAENYGAPVSNKF